LEESLGFFFFHIDNNGEGGHIGGFLFGEGIIQLLVVVEEFVFYDLSKRSLVPSF